MIILPAIDLLGGKAVRLYQGDYAQSTVYAHDPLSIVREFEDAGATWLHLVDLDGAKTGKPVNRELIRRIVSSTHLLVELGGGIRTQEQIDDYLRDGVSRVVLGTAATKEGFAAAVCRKYGERIAVGVDLRNGKVATRGWTEGSALDGAEFCKTMQDAGVQTIICTDIARDGAMQGTNLELYKTLRASLSLQLIASGGVSSSDDVAALTNTGLYGAIVGKAYYTGALDPRRAIAIGKGEAL